MRTAVSELNPNKYPALDCLTSSAHELAEKLRCPKNRLAEKPITLLVVPEGYQIELQAYIRLTHSNLCPSESSINLCKDVHFLPQEAELAPAEWTVVVIGQSFDDMDLSLIATASHSPKRRTLLVCGDRREMQQWPTRLLSRIANMHQIPMVQDPSEDAKWRSWQDIRHIFDHGCWLVSRERKVVQPTISESVFRDQFLESFMKDHMTPRAIVDFAQQTAKIALDMSSNTHKATAITGEHLLLARTTGRLDPLDFPSPYIRPSSLPPVLRVPATCSS